ncbi:LamG-like jellyroll fold domain-containing protein [Clostridioides difficile]
MAKVGEQLLQPEDGWKRIDNIDNSFKYIGLWKKDTSTGLYNNTGMYIPENDTIEEIISSHIKFAFYGSKIRILHTRYLSHSSNIKCTIDDIEYELYSIHGETIRQYLAFEKMNLEEKIHIVRVESDDSVRFDFDCIDIDTDGYMVELIEAKLIMKSTLESMEIGDIIPCKYTAPISGKVGYFSELGICNCEGIDVDTSSDTPDGKFYFVKVDNNKFIADRNVQSSISWNELNKSKLTCKMFAPNALVFDGKSSYVSIPIEKIKTTKEITIKIRVYIEDWTVGEEHRLFSCTQVGGYACCYVPEDRYFRFEISTNYASSYFITGFNVDSYTNGWKTFYISYNGESFKTYDGLTLKVNEKRNGSVIYGNTSHLVLGGEPGFGFDVAGDTRLNGKISEFAIWDKAIDPATIEDNLTGNEENLICLFKSTYAIGDKLYDLSVNKNTATISNCVKEYDYINDYYYTIPNGSVAYNNDTTVSFPKKALTSNETDEYTLNASGSLGDTIILYKAFNKSNINDSDCWHSGGEANPYIKISSKKEKIISNGFVLTNRNSNVYTQAPSSCIVYGSNDNENFEKIYESSSFPQNARAVSYHYFNSQVEYLHYKFSFTGSISYVAVGELEISKEYEYKDSSSSLINKKQGGWPIENDWDKYIRNSDLKGNIIAGDNEIWNYHDMTSLCKEKVITGLKDINNENIEPENGNILIPVRGKIEDIDDLSAKRFNICLSSSVVKNTGFRPMLITEGDE